MKPQIIATAGPTSLNKSVLERFRARNLDFIRLNLSHTELDDIETLLLTLKKSGIEVVIDTEGCQLRTGNLGINHINLNEGDSMRIYNYHISCSKSDIYIRPKEALDFVEIGSLISIDFNSALLRVVEKKIAKGYINCTVVNGGVIGSNKAVSLDSTYYLPALTQKDMKAIRLAKKHGIKYFTLSFMNSEKDVQLFRQQYSTAIAFSKIETMLGVKNFDKILLHSDGILIDRGDLSREVPLERIPFLQKLIIKKCTEAKKPVFIATHILESMCDHLKPMRSEVNDVVNTLLDGATGLVLTKETAVGHHPVESLNTLQSLVHYTELVSKSSPTSSLEHISNLGEKTHQLVEGALIQPHGGTLVNRFKLYQFSHQELKFLKKIHVDDTVIMDAEQIALGAFSPVEGFFNARELNYVLNELRLPDKTPWSLPITCPIDRSTVRQIKEREVVALVRKKDKKIYATLIVDEIYKINKFDFCMKLFGTIDSKHPGVRKTLLYGEYFIAGKVNLLNRLHTPHREYTFTPSQTRKIFLEKGWSFIVGFHTRNPIHCSHEYIQMKALEISRADGIFIHPVIGSKKSGDFNSDIIIKSYEIMIKKHYPKKKVLLGAFLTHSRYAGPREALFTAICRQNYGCSHFIVGRDHTGVGGFYHTLASQEIFKKFPELKIKPIFFNNVYYSEKHKKYVTDHDIESKSEKNKASLSGTDIRQLFAYNKLPPRWLMRPTIAQMIVEQKINGKKIFIE